MAKETIVRTIHRDAEDIAQLEQAERLGREGGEGDKKQIADLLAGIQGGDDVKYYFKLYRRVNTLPGVNKFSYLSSLSVEDFRDGGEELIKQMYGGGIYKALLYYRDTGKKVKDGGAEISIEGDPKVTQPARGAREEAYREGSNGEPDRVILEREAPPPVLPLDPIELMREIREATREGMEMARLSQPTPLPTQSNEDVVKGMASIFTQMTKMMTDSLATIESRRSDIAKSEQALGNKLFEIMERGLTQQGEQQARMVDMSNKVIEQMMNLADLKSQLSSSGVVGVEPSWIDVVTKLLDVVKERGPDFIGAFKQGIIEGVKQQTLPPMPASPSQVVTFETAPITEPVSSPSQTGEVEDTGTPLVDIAEGMIRKAHQQSIAYPVLFQSLILLAEPTDLAELLDFYQAKEFLPEFYEGDLGVYSQKFVEYLLELQKKVKEAIPSATTNP